MAQRGPAERALERMPIADERTVLPETMDSTFSVYSQPNSTYSLPAPPDSTSPSFYPAPHLLHMQPRPVLPAAAAMPEPFSPFVCPPSTSVGLEPYQEALRQQHSAYQIPSSASFGQASQGSGNMNPTYSAGYSQQYVLATGGQLPHGQYLQSVQSKLTTQAPPPGYHEPCACTAGWLLFGIGWVFPPCWLVSALLPFCSKTVNRNNRTAAIASAVMLAVYLVVLGLAVAIPLSTSDSGGQQPG